MSALALALWQAVKPHAAVLGACLVIGLGGFWLGYHAGHPAPPVPVQIAHHDTQQAAATAAAAETVFVHDTLRYAQWRATYDTLRDTLNVRDTVQVLRYVFVADSTIAACNRALESCARAGVAKDSVIAAQHREILALQPTRPSRGRRLLTEVAYAAAGYEICKAGLSIPFFR